MLGLFRKFKDGLAKTVAAIAQKTRGLFGGRKIDAASLEQLEEALYTADFGVETTGEILAEIKRAYARDPELQGRQAAEIGAAVLRRVLEGSEGRWESAAATTPGRPVTIALIGVNGSGKTTSAAKLAWRLRQDGRSVLLAACDTFRAAAVEQLKVWAERARADFMSRPTGADAAGLAYDAVEKARAEGHDVVLIDTAGRLQNKQGLMDELLKVIRVIKKVDPDAPHETLLVLDATVGRNALAQENIFGNQIGVSGIVMTKLDGTARGGVLVPVAQASDSPIKLIGVGEGIDDLQPFDAKAFARSVVGLGED